MADEAGISGKVLRTRCLTGEKTVLKKLLPFNFNFIGVSSLNRFKVELVPPKIEVDLGEDPDCTAIVETSPLMQNHHDQIFCNELTSGDVATEKIMDDDDDDSKTELTFLLTRDNSTCTVCRKQFKYERSLKNHIKYCGKTKNDIAKHKCNICNYETKLKRLLQRHLKLVHYAVASNRPSCTGCEKSFKHQIILNRHVKYCEKLNNNIVKEKCDICGYETKWKHYLALHYRNVHAMKAIERPICTGCGKSYKNKESLKQHVIYCEKLNNTVVKFKCFHCSLETKWKAHLRAHLRRIHPIGIVERPTCPGCAKSYKHEEGLKWHMQFCNKCNNEIVIYKCKFCCYETKWRSYVKDHMRRVHRPPTIESSSQSPSPKMKIEMVQPKIEVDLVENLIHDFDCTATDKLPDETSRQLTSVDVDVEKIVDIDDGMSKSELTQPSTQDCYVCKVCKKCFSSGVAWNTHVLRGCKKELQLECSYCSFQTESIDDMRSHSTLEHEAMNSVFHKEHPVGATDRPTCSGCRNPFKNEKSLQKHIKYCDKLNNAIVKHKCKFCKYETKWSRHLLRHLKLVHRCIRFSSLPLNKKARIVPGARLNLYLRQILSPFHIDIKCARIN